MRFTHILILALLCPVFAFAQQVKEGKVKVGKTEMSGFIASTRKDRTAVETAVMGKLQQAGLNKYKKKKKFFVYKEVSFPALSPTRIDLYYRVIKKKRRSRILFVVSKGYDNYITSATDATIAANVTTFLGSIDAAVDHNDEIKRKEEEMKQMNADLQKQKDDLQKAEDEKNRKAQELQQLKKSK